MRDTANGGRDGVNAMASNAEVQRSAARVGSKALIREINEALVLDVVRRRGETSRAEITAITGLSPATVTGITAQLVGDGLLIESQVLRGTGGRPARLLQLGSVAVVAAGVRLSIDSVEVVLVDLRGDVVATHQESLQNVSPDAAADAVAAAVSAVRERVADARMLGVSVALSGIVDRPRGIVRHSGSFGWHDVPFAEMVAQRCSTRVVIDSLVNAFATGLLLLDDDLAERDAIIFSVGVSLGASVLVGGRIHRGHAGAAGGFAHGAPGPRDEARPCHCGDVGCLETWSSIGGMRAEIERRGSAGDALDGQEAGAVLDDGGRHLGIAMANTAKMFGPEQLVLVQAPELEGTAFERACREAFTLEYAHSETPAPPLALTPADTDVFARGAGYGMINELFTADAR
ncbi:ROK family protein [Microbacterium sp. H1-D42]|uniref:ROK family protein n=1 Tax=Microbacterium sp. H1-D42 TaxID=2925844 RepID=UPI001F536158|nr:ROK family protein [Microbacterium sp. H1-D42]UNK71395.1 ROK family protein [Microbacterium sp. H1-D42]